MDWVTLGATLANIVANIVNIAKYFEGKKKDGFDELIENTYRDMEHIVADCFKLLRETQEILEASHYSGEGIQQAHQYLSTAREVMLPSRLRIRAALSIDYFKEPGLLADFCSEILAIMYSGYDATATTTANRQSYLGDGITTRHTLLILLQSMQHHLPGKILNPSQYSEFDYAQRDLSRVFAGLRTNIEDNWEALSRSYYLLLESKQ